MLLLGRLVRCCSDMCDVAVAVEPVEVWKPEANPFNSGEMDRFSMLPLPLQRMRDGTRDAHRSGAVGLSMLTRLTEQHDSDTFKPFPFISSSSFTTGFSTREQDSLPRVPEPVSQGDPSMFTHYLLCLSLLASSSEFVDF